MHTLKFRVQFYMGFRVWLGIAVVYSMQPVLWKIVRVQRSSCEVHYIGGALGSRELAERKSRKSSPGLMPLVVKLRRALRDRENPFTSTF